MSGTSDARRVVAGRYTLTSLLGRGGAGSVWRAHDDVLDRPVAVKQIDLPAGLDDQERQRLYARVLREARAAARLDHPGVVTIYDALPGDDRAYIVMEVVDAPSLADVVADSGTLSPGEAARIGLEVLDTLEAAHAQGIVHRDVKPSNMVVPATGRVRLMDFGIASVQGDPAITTTGLVLGSPSYIAPEQARDGRAGPPADLWGLGATLYYAVEGVAPFDRGGPLPTVTAVLTEEHRPTEHAGPLGPVIDALLRKDPAERPSTARTRELLDAVATGEAAEPGVAAVPPLTRRLEPAHQPAPTPAGEPTSTRWLEPERERRPGRSLAVLFGLVALLGIAAFAVVQALPADPPANSPTAGPTATEQAPAAPATPAPTRTPPAQATPTPQPSPTSQPSPTEPEPTPTPEPEPTEADTGSPAAVGPDTAPEGWTTYTDDAVGYQLAYPEGWEVIDQEESITDFRDPETGTYLRIDWTDNPPESPEGAWQELSDQFAESRENYEELQITPTTYRGFDAALWEFTYSEGGADLHAYDLGVDTGDYGYGLNFQTHEENWKGSQDLWDTFKRVFLPGR